MILNTIDYKEKIKNMSLSELEVMISDAEIAAKNNRITDKQNIIKEIMAIAAHINMGAVLTDLNVKPIKTKRGVKIEISYRDPENFDHTWTGRGFQPLWLRGKLDAGHKLGEFTWPRSVN